MSLTYSRVIKNILLTSIIFLFNSEVSYSLHSSFKSFLTREIIWSVIIENTYFTYIVLELHLRDLFINELI